jgi:hypothetical protein
MLISGNTVCERILEGFKTIITLGDRLSPCAYSYSARSVRPPLPQLFRRPYMIIADSNQSDHASTTSIFTTSKASYRTSTLIRATYAATHTASCTFASSTVRLSVLVLINIAIG